MTPDLAQMVFQPVVDVVFREHAGELLLVPIRHRVGDLTSVYVSNAVGAAIWRRLDGNATTRQLVESLEAEYDVDRLRLEDDVLEFLLSLESAGLIARKTAVP